MTTGCRAIRLLHVSALSIKAQLISKVGVVMAVTMKTASVSWWLCVDDREDLPEPPSNREEILSAVRMV